MFQRFFTKTIESKFIKNLLANTPIPRYKFVSDGDYLFCDSMYIYGGKIIKCTKNGIIGNISTTFPIVDKINYEIDKCDYKVIQDYTFGESYPQFTEKYKSEYSYYDSSTHEKLGDYLRAYRSTYNIDLLPFYNCFSGRYANNFYIKKTHTTKYSPIEDIEVVVVLEDWKLNVEMGLWENKVILNELKSEESYSISTPLDWETTILKNILNFYAVDKPVEDRKIIVNRNKLFNLPEYQLINNINNNIKIIQVPIKFNTVYTIALDCASEILIQPALISNGRPVTIYTAEKLKVDLTNELATKVTQIERASFKNPFTYSINLDIKNKYAKYFEVNEKNLYLLIQVPKALNTSIVVLDGNFTSYAQCKKYFDKDFIYEASENEKNKLFLSALSLLKLNDKNSYAFSDRLLEYLTLNVITPIETIDNNILLAQESQYLTQQENISKYIWSDYMRYFYFKAIMNNKNIEHYDLNGFIDKTIEKNYITDRS